MSEKLKNKKISNNKNITSNSNENEKDNNKKPKSFSVLYKILKDNVDVPYSLDLLIDKTKGFAIPILCRILFLLTFIKISIIYSYFIFWTKTWFNFSILINLTLLILSFIFMYFNNFSDFFIIKTLGDYLSLRLLKVTYIFLYVLDSNYLCYYHKDFNFQMSLIIPVYLATLFFEK